MEREVEGCRFPDERLKSRFREVLSQLGRKIGETLPSACQDWAATKAAYRFFSNPRVNESIILAGHFAATRARMAAAKGPVLIVHDTTEFTFQRDKPEAIGKTSVLASRPHRNPHTVCGLLMHSSLAVTPQGNPLLPNDRAAAYWQTEEVPPASPHGHSCTRARQTRRKRTNSLEAPHGFTGCGSGFRDGETK